MLFPRFGVLQTVQHIIDTSVYPLLFPLFRPSLSHVITRSNLVGRRLDPTPPHYGTIHRTPNLPPHLCAYFPFAAAARFLLCILSTEKQHIPGVHHYWRDDGGNDLRQYHRLDLEFFQPGGERLLWDNNRLFFFSVKKYAETAQPIDVFHVGITKKTPFLLR